MKIRSREHRDEVQVRSWEHSHAGNGVKMSREHGNMGKMRRRENGSLVQREGHVIKHEHTILLKRNKKHEDIA
jgi:hypothetical protein